jgi:hypothetical protein
VDGAAGEEDAATLMCCVRLPAEVAQVTAYCVPKLQSIIQKGVVAELEHLISSSFFTFSALAEALDTVPRPAPVCLKECTNTVCFSVHHAWLHLMSGCL